MNTERILRILRNYRRHIELFGVVFLVFCAFFIIFYAQLQCLQWSHTMLTYLVVNALLFAAPCWLMSRRHGVCLLIYLVLCSVLLTANVVYSRYYGNIIPLSAYLRAGNLEGQYINLIASLKATDFLYLSITLVLYIYYLLRFRRKLPPLKLLHRALLYIGAILTACLLFGASITMSYTKGISIRKKFTPTSVPLNSVCAFGVVPMWVIDIINIIDNKPLTDIERTRIDEFLKAGAPLPTSSPDTANINTDTGKNLILILVESLDTWVTQWNGGHAAPFLHSLSSQPHTVYIPNVLPQVNYGRSSDAQLIINTGLLPPSNDMVVYAYSDQYYPALAEGLKQRGYYSLTVMGNSRSCWNQQVMNTAYHIDTLIAQEQLVSDTLVSLGIADRSVFRQTVPILAALKRKAQPFYAQLITLSSHDGQEFAHSEDIQCPDDMPAELAQYIKAMRYVDAAIQYFIEQLKAAGLYDNSIIVITGDHESGDTKSIESYAPELLYLGERFTPLYILNTEKQYTQGARNVMGQIDIFPSLMDIFALPYSWKGVGKSIFSAAPPKIAVNKHRQLVGDSLHNSEREHEAWQISDLIIRKQYFRASPPDHQ